MFKKIVAAAALTGGLVLAGAGVAAAAAGSDSSVADNPGILNGIVVQAPISVPVNACAISIPVVAMDNPVDGNVCIAD